MTTFTPKERETLLRIIADIDAAYELGTHRQNASYTDIYDSERKALVLRALRFAVDAMTVLTDPAAFHFHALRNGLLSRQNALHLAGATDYDTLQSKLAEQEIKIARLREQIRSMAG